MIFRVLFFYFSFLFAAFAAYQEPHQILGVSEDAQEPEIKKAYHRWVQELHFDRFKENMTNYAERVKAAEKKFIEVHDAYQKMLENLRSPRPRVRRSTPQNKPSAAPEPPPLTLEEVIQRNYKRAQERLDSLRREGFSFAELFCLVGDSAAGQLKPEHTLLGAQHYMGHFRAAKELVAQHLQTYLDTRPPIADVLALQALWDDRAINTLDAISVYKNPFDAYVRNHASSEVYMDALVKKIGSSLFFKKTAETERAERLSFQAWLADFDRFQLSSPSTELTAVQAKLISHFSDQPPDSFLRNVQTLSTYYQGRRKLALLIFAKQQFPSKAKNWANSFSYDKERKKNEVKEALKKLTDWVQEAAQEVTADSGIKKPELLSWLKNRCDSRLRRAMWKAYRSFQR